MGIQTELGRDITDMLVLKSLFYLSSSPSAADNALALLQADRDLYGGAHLATLTHWLGTVKKFLPPETHEMILFVHDDDGVPRGSVSEVSSGDQSTGSHHTSSSLFDSAWLPAGYLAQTTSFQEMDTASIAQFRAVVLIGGLNPEPFADAGKRAALVRYVLGGGKILVEGGDVGYFYRMQGLTEVDHAFRRVVLHESEYINDAIEAEFLYGSPDEPLFTTPHHIAGPLLFGPAPTVSARDALIPHTSDGKVFSIGRWSHQPATGAIIAAGDGSGGVQGLFLPLAVTALADTVVARLLIENALVFLLIGTTTVTSSTTEWPESPITFSLNQNFPNPFNPSTTIRFSLPGNGAPVAVTLEVFDVLGRPVATLLRGDVAPGNHEELFNAEGLPSGVYMYRLSAQLPNGKGRFQKTRRMLLLK
jgi:hypothetical protein